MRKSIRVLLAAAGLLAARPAMAHAPYEQKAGTFRRSDGQDLAIIKSYGDGIIAPDPESVQFRLPNGINVAATPPALDHLIRLTEDGVELYTFRQHWLPVAEEVLRFDGYAITRQTTLGKRFLSLWLHLWDAGWLYLSFLAGALFILFSAQRAAGARFPRRFVPLRWLAVIGICLLAAIYAFLVLAAPVSPLIIAAALLFVSAARRLIGWR